VSRTQAARACRRTATGQPQSIRPNRSQRSGDFAISIVRRVLLEEDGRTSTAATPTNNLKLMQLLQIFGRIALHQLLDEVTLLFRELTRLDRNVERERVVAVRPRSTSRSLAFGAPVRTT
jgi:hypothetical protein